jgi:hypothetical protein
VSEVERFREMSREFWRVWAEEGGDELVARYADFFVPDAVWAPPTGQVAGRTYIGRDGFAEYVEDDKGLFVSCHGDLNEDSVELVGDLLLRTRVSVVATLREGGAIDATLHTVTQTDGMRTTYAWATYEPDAAKRKIAELVAEQEAANA